MRLCRSLWPLWRGGEGGAALRRRCFRRATPTRHHRVGTGRSRVVWRGAGAGVSRAKGRGGATTRRGAGAASHASARVPCLCAMCAMRVQAPCPVLCAWWYFTVRVGHGVTKVGPRPGPVSSHMIVRKEEEAPGWLAKRKNVLYGFTSESHNTQNNLPLGLRSRGECLPPLAQELLLL